MLNRTSISVILILIAITAGLTWNAFRTRPRTIAHGCFHQVAHKGEGCATLVRRRDGSIVLQLTDFNTVPSLDLHLLLITATDARENSSVEGAQHLDLGPLQNGEGYQEYVVPGVPDLTNYRSVTIWNTKYRVNFATAPLQQF